MGKLEDSVKRKIRKTRIQEAILVTLASGGRVGPQQLVKLTIDDLLGSDLATPPPRRVEIIKSATSRLKQKGLIVYDGEHYALTKSGQVTLETWVQSGYQVHRPRKWDGKWRVVIFDIPEKKRRTRDRAREILEAAGFRKLQNSVWVLPYSCEDVIGLMKTDLGIGKNMLYLVVDELENDRFLRMDFGLID